MADHCTHVDDVVAADHGMAVNDGVREDAGSRTDDDGSVDDDIGTDVGARIDFGTRIDECTGMNGHAAKIHGSRALCKERRKTLLSQFARLAVKWQS